MVSPKICVAGLVLGLLTLLAGIIVFSVKEKVEMHTLVHNMRIVSGALAYDLWTDEGYDRICRIFIFHVANADDVASRGTKPELQQRGPFTYREKRSKVGAKWSDETVKYRQSRRWVFDSDKSYGNEDDVVTIPNLPLLFLVNSARFMETAAIAAAEQFLNKTKAKLFVTKKVREVLFDGYVDELLDNRKEAEVQFGVNFPDDKFGWFVGRNNNDLYDGTFEVATGKTKGRHGDAGQVVLWNDTKVLPMFEAPCSNVNGTGGFMWPPCPIRTTVTYFDPDFCRSVTMIYESTQASQGLDTYRFLASPRLLAGGLLAAENACFCSVDCPPSGLLNLTSCRHHLPIFLSHPHFLFADGALLEKVTGLSPDEQSHRTFLDMDARTSVPMYSQTRIQLNVLVRPVTGLSSVTKLAPLTGGSPLYLPVVWHEAEQNVTESMAGKVYKQVRFYPKMLKIVSYVCIGLGSFLSLVAGVLLVLSLVQRRRMGPTLGSKATESEQSETTSSEDSSSSASSTGSDDSGSKS